MSYSGHYKEVSIDDFSSVRPFENTSWSKESKVLPPINTRGFCPILSETDEQTVNSPLPEDLAYIVEIWSRLTPSVKECIVTLANTAVNAPE